MNKELLLTSICVFSSTFALAKDREMDKLSASKKVVAANTALKLRPTYQECIDGSFAATPSLLKCAGDEFAFQDKRLNQVYTRLMASKPPAERAALRSEERKWLAEKGRRCSPGPDPGQGDNVAAADCDVGETARRATELEARVTK